MPVGRKRFGILIVEFGEPFVGILQNWLEQDSVGYPPHAHTIAREPKFARQTYGLAAAVLKELGGFLLGH